MKLTTETYRLKIFWRAQEFGNHRLNTVMYVPGMRFLEEQQSLTWK